MAYVYAHIRQDTLSVFYIGISKSDDNKFKRAYSKDPRNKYRSNIINKTDYTVIILHKDLTIEEAKAKEIELIAMYGRKDIRTGCLCNLTDGGDGVIGRLVKPVSKETKEKLSIAGKNRQVSVETRNKISMSNKGKTLGKKQSEESKIKNSLANKGENNGMFGKSSWPICPVLQDLRKAKLSASLKAAHKLKKDNKL